MLPTSQAAGLALTVGSCFQPKTASQESCQERSSISLHSWDLPCAWEHLRLFPQGYPEVCRFTLGKRQQSECACVGWGRFDPNSPGKGDPGCVSKITLIYASVTSTNAPAPSGLEPRCGPGYLIEVVEGSPELLHLLLADPFGVTGENLVLHLIDRSGNGGEELLPANTDMLETPGERQSEE